MTPLPRLLLLPSFLSLLSGTVLSQAAYNNAGYSASGVAAPSAATGYESAPAVPPAPAPPRPAPPPPPPAPRPATAPSPPPSPPAPSPVQNAQEMGYEAAKDLSKTHGATNLGFPLPSCYINKDGFMCCNKELENLMSNTYRNISQSRGGKWKKCNIHQVAVATQRNAEKHFGVDFELVVGAGDYASKNYFNQDLICKIKRDNSIILAFATPN